MPVRQLALSVLFTLAFLGAVLLLDGDGIARQALLGIATAAFAWLLCRRSGIPVSSALWCAAIATTGEVVLSIGWGLYSYEHALIPLYVPPGHALFYTLAAATAQQPLLRRLEGRIFTAVLGGGTALALVSLAFFGDVWGCLWWGGAVALLLRSRNRLMLSSCVVYTILLEWAGTANGNWVWAATVPFVGLTSANPPAGVGILYVLLDIIVAAVVASGRERTVVVPATVAANGGA